jgi:AhpD family alkylhydroperoxidase
VSRIPYLDAGDLAPEDQSLLERPINLFRALANRPEVLRHFGGLGDWVRWKSPADPRRRELVILAVGLERACRYEVAHHTKLALDFGASEADLDAVFAWAAGANASLGSVDLAAVGAAWELAATGTLTEKTWLALVVAVGDDEAVDLMVTAAFYSMAVRVLGFLDVDNEPEFEPFAERFDTYASSQPPAFP